jgi:single-stranded-DNA-specific exonuclease
MLTRLWQVEPECPPTHLALFGQFPHVIAQVLFNRGLTDLHQARSFLFDDSVAQDPFQMIGMGEAVERLRGAIRQGEAIAIYGDFDTDGVTATALLVQTLNSLGGQAERYIPHRVDEGYGLNTDALNALKDKGIRVVVTVDCGIRSLSEVKFGVDLGLDMIVTDHHSVGSELPRGRAVINPKQPGDKYPFKDFSGAGIAFKLAQALLRAEADSPVAPSKPVAENELLDLVALGTVADLVPLVSENRALVRRGIKSLKETERPGLVALMQQAGARSRTVDAGMIGYFLGPRLNAAGRIEHAFMAYDLLMTQYPGEAERLAQTLEETNHIRQKMTEDMVKQAREMLAAQEPDQPILIVASPDFKEGIVGLIASKLSEEAYRPAVAIHVGEAQSRGSARSIPEFNIVSAFDECSELLVRHGGHAAAAGFTVDNGNLDALRSKLRGLADRQFANSRLLPTLHIDAEAQLSEMNWQTLEALNMIAPYGFGNREPVFLTRGALVRGARVVGNDHLGLTFSDGKVVWDGIAFRRKDWAPSLSQLPVAVDVVYSLSARNWGGESRLQLEVKDLRVVP